MKFLYPMLFCDSVLGEISMLVILFSFLSLRWPAELIALKSHKLPNQKFLRRCSPQKSLWTDNKLCSLMPARRPVTRVPKEDEQMAIRSRYLPVRNKPCSFLSGSFLNNGYHTFNTLLYWASVLPHTKPNISRNISRTLWWIRPQVESVVYFYLPC